MELPVWDVFLYIKNKYFKCGNWYHVIKSRRLRFFLMYDNKIESQFDSNVNKFILQIQNIHPITLRKSSNMNLSRIHRIT